jgi:hypothetical protein
MLTAVPPVNGAGAVVPNQERGLSLVDATLRATAAAAVAAALDFRAEAAWALSACSMSEVACAVAARRAASTCIAP